jgi:circadian clock protein KaiC
LPFPSVTLVAGDIGTGKTTFCNQFLCEGARSGERGMFFAIFGGPTEWTHKFTSTYEFVRPDYFEERIRYVDLGEAVEDASVAGDVLRPMENALDGFKPRRVAIDNSIVLEDVLKDDYRRFLLKLSALLKSKGVAALITGEACKDTPYPSRAAHVADGVILLHNTEVNLVRRRSLEIVKMSGTSHLSGKHAVDISTRGLTVYPGL